MNRTRAPWLFLAPAIALFALVFVIPVAYTLIQSFLTVTASGGTGFGDGENIVSFAGLANYLSAFGDAGFLQSIVRVAVLGLIQVPIMLIFALVLALVLDARRTLGKRGFSLLYFLPYAIPGAVGAIMWAFLVQPELSPFTQIGEQLGLHIDLTAGWIIPFTIGNMLIWGFTGYNMVIFSAALKAIPTEIYEAARIDGASSWRIAWTIKVPMIRASLVMTTVFAIIGTIQLYTEPTVLKNSSPNVDPQFSPLMSIYAAVQAGDYFQAAARSIIIAIIALVLSFGFLALQRRKGAADV
ncbi:MAG: sugar ABC transporter permease [Actinobacteria bacterium]|nr:sugar ABC transporter permease [Actinomycetota bacterium]